MDRMVLTKFISAPDGGKPAFYRMAELYFATQAQMEQSLGSKEGQATVADLEKFATGGVTPPGTGRQHCCHWRRIIKSHSRRPTRTEAAL